MIAHVRNRSFVAVLGVVFLTGCASPKTPETAATSPTLGIASRLPRDAEVEAYVASMRADLSRGKVGIIADVMQLNSEEATVFWPIYQEYESELFDLGDLRVNSIRQFAADQRAGVLDDAKASRLANAYFEFEVKRLELLKAYHNIVGERLSPVRAAQFTQIEHRVGTLIDLMIAAELPLVQSAADVR